MKRLKAREAGAEKVVLSTPSKDATPMFVCGVNTDSCTGQDGLFALYN